MTSFLSVNTISSPQDHPMDGTATPTTPYPAENSNPMAAQDGSGNNNNGDTKTEDSSRPTAVSQGNASSAPDESALAESDPDRDGSDREPDPGGDSAPPSKKKKGQRFYCTDFPPCNLSFTRSEHLARHIRKHTGERPFQCHCSRRFSRLDNLRQHAQTVHVNEEIPGDSLAATGTRFQRQIRTDRVRPQGRARSGTTGSQGTHSRGHSRNLSASSIASTASTYSQPPEARRRPPPLVMANDGTARARLSLDTMPDAPRTPPGQVHGIPGPAIGSPYTPSNFFSAGGGGSPHVPSPVPAASHASGFWDGKTAARRLSVPTGANPFSQQHVNAYPSYASSATPTAYSNSGSTFASPVSSNFSRDETMYGAEGDLRRRTWHPSTYSGYPRPATSGLSNYQTPEMLQPSPSAGGSSGQPTRLPGIESFDKVLSQGRPITPPVRRPSPMQVDSHTRPPPGYSFGGGFNYSRPAARPPPPVSGPGHRRGHVSWDMSLHTNLTGLNLRDKPLQRDASNWGQQTIAELRDVGNNASAKYPHPSGLGPSFPPQEHRGNSGHRPYERPQGWHTSTNSGSQVARTSPEDSSSSEGVHTPSTASLEYHPAIVHNNGYIEPHNPPMPPDSSHTGYAPLPPQPDNYHPNGKPDSPSEFFQNSSNRESGMGRLEALVAVATSEDKDSSKMML